MTNKITKIAKLKSYLTLPISALLFFAFVEKVPAKIIPEKNDKNREISENVAVAKNEIASHSLPIIASKTPINDTISPKSQKVENVIKEKNIKNKEEVDNKSQPSETIPPPALIEKIESQTQAEFPGGNVALRQKFIENFDTTKLHNKKGTVKGTISFIISEDGKSYHATYDFDDEDFKVAAESAMKKILNGVVWKPGTLNGKPASSSLKMPMTMSFQ